MWVALGSDDLDRQQLETAHTVEQPLAFTQYDR